MLTTAAVVWMLAGIGYLSHVQTTPPPGPTEVARLSGSDLYAANCASCHGANLEGQPNWKVRMSDGRLPAPPHDASGHTWHHSDRALLTIVRDGLETLAPGYKTNMPAYREKLTDAEIRAILEFI